MRNFFKFGYKFSEEKNKLKITGFHLIRFLLKRNSIFFSIKLIPNYILDNLKLFNNMNLILKLLNNIKNLSFL